MNIRRQKLCAVLYGVALLWLTGPAVFAATYQWTTPDGTIGLTDDPGRIPDQYRSTATPYGKSNQAVSTTPEISPGVAPGGTATQRPDVDLNGHDRAWWQTKIQEIRSQQAKARTKHQAADEELNQLIYFGREVPTELMQRRALEHQIKELEAELQTLERELTDELPMEARKAGAPPGWLRD